MGSLSVAIIGAGPAGGALATLLARKGHRVLLFDPKVPWEKPCGGGVTFKTFAEFEFLASFERYHPVRRLRFISPSGRQCEVEMAQPLPICSRESLGEFLVESATHAGAMFIQAHVAQMDRREGRWVLQTSEGKFEAGFLVGADGANSLVRRRLEIPIPSRPMCLGVGYYLPQTFGGEVTIKFLGDQPGYFWVFPRQDHSSVGLCATAPFLEGRKLFERLDRMIREVMEVDVPETAPKCAAQIPIFRRFIPHELAGDGWALLGDAAGLADPITKEGIYYAMKSAALLAQALERGPEASERYVQAVGNEIVREFARAGLWRKVFYQPWFLERMISSSRNHSGVREILTNLIAGRQRYRGLGRRLLSSAIRKSS